MCTNNAGRRPISAPLLGKNLGAKGQQDGKSHRHSPWLEVHGSRGLVQVIAYCVEHHRMNAYLSTEASPFAFEQSDAEIRHAQARRRII